jgi:predicted AAA+ superfamily ATPase
MCAHRAGQTLNLSAMSVDCGITHNTAKAWLSVLETCFILFRLPPHHANFGLLAYLLGLREAGQLALHPARGALFENLVISELVKRRAHAGEDGGLSFWRDKTGHEVDCLIETVRGPFPVEIKSGRTVTADFFGGLTYWTELARRRLADAFVIYAGAARHTRDGVSVLPWTELARLPS